jgi:hypothetical protein
VNINSCKTTDNAAKEKVLSEAACAAVLEIAGGNRVIT